MAGPCGELFPGAPDGALPNLVVIGAMKCGTTLLHHYLDLYSDIAMTRRKELNFFSARPTGTLRTATSDRAAGE